MSVNKTILSDANISQALYQDLSDTTPAAQSFYHDFLKEKNLVTLTSDTKIIIRDIQKTILSDTKIIVAPKIIVSDAVIKIVGEQKTILSDAFITAESNKFITSDSKIKVIDLPVSIFSNSKIIIRNIQKTILSDARLIIVGEQKTILSDAKISIQVLSNLNNKVNFAKQLLYNINNKVNSCKRILSNINNKISFVKNIISNINNDIRTHKINKSNINNDVRFLIPSQVPGSVGFQSLGKTYIKVYINSVEVTDVDVDSININKSLDSAHTATFELARAYDSTKPNIESEVEIKYHVWTLYSGYISSISPSDNPEKIHISCQDEYWKQNRTKVYFQVGHKPITSDDLYYETIQAALNIEYTWSLSYGNIVPEVINCYHMGKSDALTNLINEMGNFSWYYDVDGSKKLWKAGAGNIVDIQRQIIGTNIGLYQLLSHNFSENIGSLVNQYRVQMGEQVINKSRTVVQYASYHQFLSPAWNSAYETLAKNTISGEGWDYHTSENANLYADVFKKYNMPYLDSNLSSWSDRYAPYLEIYNITSQAFGFVGELGLDYVMTLTEGFTIDYENKTITLAEPLFLYQTDSAGEIIAIRRPIIKAFLWKKTFYTYSDEGENPLEFTTAKMGDYPTIVKSDLELSQLTIQDSYTYIYYQGTRYEIPPYNDTEYASDIANWNLSKICDKKISGSIDLTLDALCYYNINLSNRIYIDGITDEAMNILAIDYDINNFIVRLQLENSRGYTRTISIPWHGEY